MPKHLTRKDVIQLAMIAVTAAGITLTAILFRQSFVRIIPLYVSLFVSLLNSRINRYGLLLGGFNCIGYTLVYWYYGLYGNAAYAFFCSFPIQILTFILWSKRAYRSSTVLRRMTGKQRIAVAAGFVAAWCAVLAVLSLTDSSYKLLDTTVSMLGVLITILTLLRFVEYTWLNPVCTVISTVLYIAMLRETPEQATYLVYNVYCLITLIIGFFSARSLWREQNAGNAPDGAAKDDVRTDAAGSPETK